MQEVGYLPSEALFYPGMKVRDILKFSADLRRKDCAEEARALSDRLQLDTSRCPSATERRSRSCARSKAIRHC